MNKARVTESEGVLYLEHYNDGSVRDYGVGWAVDFMLVEGEAMDSKDLEEFIESLTWNLPTMKSEIPLTNYLILFFLDTSVRIFGRRTDVRGDAAYDVRPLSIPTEEVREILLETKKWFPDIDYQDSRVLVCTEGNALGWALANGWSEGYLDESGKVYPGKMPESKPCACKPCAYRAGSEEVMDELRSLGCFELEHIRNEFYRVIFKEDVL